MFSNFHNREDKQISSKEDISYSEYLKINEELYKRNAELALKNKTLSLLQKLYEISVITLEPKDLITKITKLIQQELEFELVQIMLYDHKKDMLESINGFVSARLNQVLTQLNCFINNIKINSVSTHYFLAPVVLDDRMNFTESLSVFFSDCLDKNILEKLKSTDLLKTIIVYPLKAENKVGGVLIVGISRFYSDLLDFEKQTISSFINVISVALDRAFIYQKLKTANRQLIIANRQLKELDKLKSEFISIASHQLRGPLTVIKGYISMIIEGSFGKINNQIKKALNDVYYSNEKMIGLVNELLTTSRIEKGTVTLVFQKGDFNKFVASIVRELGWKAKEKKIRLIFLPSKLPKVVFDSDKMRHAIYNVIDNAIKYTDKGKVEVFTKSFNNKVQVLVKDTGIGVTLDEKEKLFKRFTRGDEALRLHPEGTGLGLFLVKQIVLGHKGRVWVESKGRYKGSTFFIEIPINLKVKKFAAKI